LRDRERCDQFRDGDRRPLALSPFSLSPRMEDRLSGLGRLGIESPTPSEVTFSGKSGEVRCSCMQWTAMLKIATDPYWRCPITSKSTIVSTLPVGHVVARDIADGTIIATIVVNLLLTRS